MHTLLQTPTSTQATPSHSESAGRRRPDWRWSWLAGLLPLLLAACSLSGSGAVAETDHEGQAGLLALPELEQAALDGGLLEVAATTSILGDVVAQVGGNSITLTTLMGPGQDPHSYEPAARELATVSTAHVIFINGWGLEEALVSDLAEIAGQAPLVPISAGITPLPFEESDHEEHESSLEEEGHSPAGADPHVWFSIASVQQWVENVQQVLEELDPAHAETYGMNAAAYLAELEELEGYARSQLAGIPEDKRFLVTNHDSLGYFAHAYGFEVLGTVIPAASTLAEPSPGDLADLISVMEAHSVCTIFTETTVSDTLAQTVAAELDHCDAVRVVRLYTGALGPAGSGADTFIGMYRHNLDAIVEGLR